MRHTISVTVENKPGVLARVAGLFSARGYNIASLAVSETLDPTISYMTMVVEAQDERILEQIKKQLNKLIDVITITANGEPTLYPYLEGTNMQAAFGHLMGYAAAYYGYLWSKVYAEDMYSVFERNGVMDKKTGRRYRDIILAKGGSEDELSLVKEFLQREPDQEAFFKSLGLNDMDD